eukprot:3204996-Prymnesium_polylepis.1
MALETTRTPDGPRHQQVQVQEQRAPVHQGSARPIPGFGKVLALPRFRINFRVCSRRGARSRASANGVRPRVAGAADTVRGMMAAC